MSRASAECGIVFDCRARLFLLYRILAHNPFIPAALEYCGILESCACELLRHTGAGGLVGSGAV